MTRIRPCTLARLAPLVLLAAHAASAQAPAASQVHQHDSGMPMDPSMQMDPKMHMDPPPKTKPKPMDPSMPMDMPAHGRSPRTHGKAESMTMDQPSNKPITEPTVAPSESGEETPMHMHHIDHVTPHLPEIGQSKHPDAARGPVYALEDLEARALAHNPTLAEARHDITAAQGIRRQVGLPPNPTVGYYGDEIRGGAYRSGKQGFFLDQPVILGGKLGLNRKIEDQSIHQAVAAGEAQQIRVRNATREAYYRVLAGQELLHLKRDLAGIAHSTTGYTHEIANTGQADPTEVLRTEVAEQHMLIAVGVQENMLRRAWTELTAIVGEPSLPLGTVQGDLEALPSEPDEAALLDDLLAHSPEMRYTQAGVAKAEAALKRARRDPIPDLVTRGGISQDNEPLDLPGSRVGLVGFAEIGLQIHLFDRNQGNVDAVRANLERARQEATRVQLSLRSREAAVVDDYRNARLIATRYRTEILPRTQQAYELMTKQYGLMDASFLRVLNLQSDLYGATEDYVQALQDAQTRYVVLHGFLYSDGLDAPGTANSAAASGSGSATPMSSNSSAQTSSSISTSGSAR